MKLTNAQIFDLATSLEQLMEKQMPVKLAFQLSRIFLALENQRKAIALVVGKLPKGEDGMPEAEPFRELLSIENDIPLEPVDPEEFFQAFSSITPKQALALLPILKGGES